MPLRRAGGLALAAFLCLAAIASISVATASGAVIHEYRSQATEVPAAPGVALPGPLTEVSAMTVDEGTLFVAERGRIDAFSASTGAFLSQFPPSSSMEEIGSLGLGAGSSTGAEQVYAGAVTKGEGTRVVVVYDGEGNQLAQPWTGADTPAGSFNFFGGGASIAVDHSSNVAEDWAAGDVYVTDSAHNVVDVFKPLAGGGEKWEAQIEGLEPGVPFPEPPSLVAVNPASGVVVVGYASGVAIFKPTAPKAFSLVRQITGSPAGGFTRVTAEGSQRLAVAANGDIYLAEFGLDSPVYQFAATGEYLGRLPGTPARAFHHVDGLAIDPASGNVFVGDEYNPSQEEPGAIDLFGPNLIVPDLATGSASDVTWNRATLNGTVNPRNAGEATCRFVWGTNSDFGHTSACPGPIANGESAVPVQVELTGLTPDTTYVYRLQASNANGLNPGEPIQNQEVHTLGPGIHGQWSSNVAATSASLAAKIDPNGSPTTYDFEYGISALYGTAVPAAPGTSIGANSGDVTVSQHVQGLLPATTYHFRVVAHSELPGGEVVEVTGPDTVLTTQPSNTGPTEGTALLDGRAWELVSPPDKHGAGLESPTKEGGVIQASAGGDAVTYVATAPTESEPPANRALEYTQLVSRRTSSRWSTKVITPPFTEPGGYLVGLGGAEYRMFSADLATAALQPFGPTALSSEASEGTPYLRHDDSCEASPASCYQPLVTGPNTPPPSEINNLPLEFVTATPDLKHILIQSPEALTPDAVFNPPAGNLYEWTAGALRLVTANSPVSRGNMRNAISQDGSRIIYAADVEGELHLHQRDLSSSETLQLDSVASGASGGRAAMKFQLATDDGSKVWFTDTARLTTDATAVEGQPDLYEVDTKARKLRDLTVDHNHGEHASVVGLVQAATGDGSYLYFVADGVLAPGATAGDCRHAPYETGEETSLTCNLYVLHEGVITFVAAISGDDQRWGTEANNADLSQVTSRLSPNGRWFAFMSDRSLTGYDNRDANSGRRDEEVFLYDAVSKRLRCVSCNPSGARPIGMREPTITGATAASPLVDRRRIWSTQWLAATVPGWTLRDQTTALYQSRYLSDSGRMFFNSNDALVPQDVNGTFDVYEFEPSGEGSCTDGTTTLAQSAGGCVAMISSGLSPDESAFMDASTTGNDVFFLTAAKLRPEDVDTALDLYDARICTSASPCLSSPAAIPPPCDTADSCRPAPTPQPSIFGPPSSATFTGPANVVATRATPPGASAHSRKGRLARALASCRRKYRKRGRGRARCERAAHHAYGARVAHHGSVRLTERRLL
jgi:hypothetical protein